MLKTTKKPVAAARIQAAQALASRRAVLAIRAAGAAIMLAAVAGYFNSFSVPFVFDDIPSIVDNRSVHHLGNLHTVLFSKQSSGLSLSGRPLASLSIAINYALGGETVQGYHAFNLLIHILAGLVLFGLVRRTLQRPALAAQFGSAALPLGLAVAIIWTLHPLQTESVTYVVQRTEELMGLCYLLTLYCFIRGVESTEPDLWNLSALVACALGMASKEVMVSAPLMVFLYDGLFVAGSFREAWQRRKSVHRALAACWLLLAYLMTISGSREGTVGFGLGVSSWSYALTQCRAVVHYLQLFVWPHPLVFNYNNVMAQGGMETWLQMMLLLALAAGTVVALRRRLAVGFLGAWFFVILAPSSSLVPVVSQPIAEHRMYLPLAGLVTLVVTGLYFWLRRRSWPVFAVLAAACLGLTVERNSDYRSDISLWNDTVTSQPESLQAHVCLANAYAARKQWPEAEAQFDQALRLQPENPYARNSFGVALMNADRSDEAIAQFKQAIQARPNFALAEYDLGLVFDRTGQTASAVVHYERAVRINPSYGEAEFNLGNALMAMNRKAEAMRHFEQAVRLMPDYPEAELILAVTLVAADQVAQAIPHFERAVALNPSSAELRLSFARALAGAGRHEDAVKQYERVLRLNPKDADTHISISAELRQLGRIIEANQHYREAIRLNPSLPPPR